MNDYEVNSSISNDKKLAKITMEGLTSYAELLEKQESASPAVTQIRRIVDELGAYWDVDEKHNWIGEFAKRALGRISVDIQEKIGLPPSMACLVMLKKWEAHRGLMNWRESWRYHL